MLHTAVSEITPIALRPSTRRSRLKFELCRIGPDDDLDHAESLLQRYRGSLRQRFTDIFGPITLSSGTIRWGDADGRLSPVYLPPQGLLLVAYQGQTPAGCVALRPAAAAKGHALIERLFVEPRFRRHGLGHALMQGAASGARELGYRQVRFALPGMVIAPFAVHAGTMLIDSCG